LEPPGLPPRALGYVQVATVFKDISIKVARGQSGFLGGILEGEFFLRVFLGLGMARRSIGVSYKLKKNADNAEILEGFVGFLFCQGYKMS
jgi:hypothetical protein